MAFQTVALAIGMLTALVFAFSLTNIGLQKGCRPQRPVLLAASRTFHQERLALPHYQLSKWLGCIFTASCELSIQVLGLAVLDSGRKAGRKPV